MKTQSRKLIPAMLTWLLIAAMLLVSLPLCVSADDAGLDREPSLKDDLIIHYDFKGNTIEEQLSDKAVADGVATNLSVINTAVTLDANGNVTNTKDNSLVSISNGVISAGNDGGYAQYGSKRFGVTTGSTADTKKIHIQNTPTELTWYMRVSIEDFQNWTVLLGMRNTTTNHRVGMLNIDDTNNLEFISSGIVGNEWQHNEVAKSNLTFAEDSNGKWVELAVVRTPASAANSNDKFCIYVWNGTAWAQQGNNIGCATAHNTYSSENLVMSLFANVNGSFEGWNQNLLKYDDVRVYTKALSTDDLKVVHNEVVEVTPAVVDNSDIVFKGIQRSTNTTGEPATYSVRLIAEVKQSVIVANETYAGFNVTINGTTKRLPVDVYFTKLLAQTEKTGEQQEITPREGYVLIAIVIDKITTDALNMTVTPYLTVSEADTKNVRTVDIALSGGKVTSCTWAD